MTKEERKLIKGGRAYRRWRRRVVIGIAGFILWAFWGMPLAHMNNITRAIYTIGLIVMVGVVFYFLILTIENRNFQFNEELKVYEALKVMINL